MWLCQVWPCYIEMRRRTGCSFGKWAARTFIHTATLMMWERITWWVGRRAFHGSDYDECLHKWIDRRLSRVMPSVATVRHALSWAHANAGRTPDSGHQIHGASRSAGECECVCLCSAPFELGDLIYAAPEPDAWCLFGVRCAFRSGRAHIDAFERLLMYAAPGSEICLETWMTAGSLRVITPLTTNNNHNERWLRYVVYARVCCCRYGFTELKRNHIAKLWWNAAFI